MLKSLDPTRRSMPLQEWPVEDQRAWINATAAGHILDGEGPAAHWAPQTKETNRRHYGRWLSFLANGDRLNLTMAPPDRVTPALVGEYHDLLLQQVAPRTRLCLLVGLKEVARAMAPERSWRWLQDLCNRVQRNAPPSVNKRLRVRSSATIYRRALRELAQATALPMTQDNAIVCRDLFMLALIASRPVRSSNLAAIRLGEHLVKQSGIWRLSFPPDQVKNRQPISFEIPATLAPWLDHYLAVIRPQFRGSDTSDLLWLCKNGPNIDPHFPYYRLTKLTSRLFGAPINPHLFRDCAATELAFKSPGAVNAARALLGHRHASTTARYYVQAKDLDASRQLNAILQRIKSSPEALP